MRLLPLGLLALLAGCGREDEPRVYTTPKDAPASTPAAAPTGPAMAGDVPMSQQTLPEAALNRSGNPDWVVPAGWSEAPASAMRRATFTVQGAEGTAELAVTSFPGDVGGPLANVNRWRRQLGLDALPPEGLADGLSVFENTHYPMTLAEMDNGTDATLAVTLVHEGNSWFFKMTGPVALVARERAAFLAFVQSVHFPHD